MDKHTSYEQAYKNGYEAGFKDGYDGGVDVGKRHALMWIPVTERLPERYKFALLWDAIDKDIFMGVLDNKREWYIPGYQDESFHITHWMPLPEPPKGE